MTEIVVPGQVLAQKYRLLRRLGQGGMGVVWEAEHLALGSRVAIKLLDPVVSGHADIAERFLREARAAATLQCAHVVRVFDHDSSEGRPFIVMERLVGETLAERLDREGPMTPIQTFSIVQQLCLALTRAHQEGIVHRDIKPSNVFLTLGEGQHEVVKVLDFGIAKHLADSRRTDPPTGFGVVMGTPWYMSPEQAQGLREIDYGTDLWATGVLTFECLTGRRPFEHESFRDLVDAICKQPHPSSEVLGGPPGEFDNWFRRATSRDRNERFANADELVEALQSALGIAPRPQRGPSRRGTRSQRLTARVQRSIRTLRSPSASFATSGAREADASNKRDSRKALTITALIGLVACVLSISLRPKSEASDGPARALATVSSTMTQAPGLAPLSGANLGPAQSTHWVPMAAPNPVPISLTPIPSKVPPPRVTPASFDVASSTPNPSVMERPVQAPPSASATERKPKQKPHKPALASKQVIDLGI
jgi:serine/threonine-protein kinase